MYRAVPDVMYQSVGWEWHLVLAGDLSVEGGVVRSGFEALAAADIPEGALTCCLAMHGLEKVGSVA